MIGTNTALEHQKVSHQRIHREIDGAPSISQVLDKTLTHGDTIQRANVEQIVHPQTCFQNSTTTIISTQLESALAKFRKNTTVTDKEIEQASALLEKLNVLVYPTLDIAKKMVQLHANISLLECSSGFMNIRKNFDPLAAVFVKNGTLSAKDFLHHEQLKSSMRSLINDTLDMDIARAIRRTANNYTKQTLDLPRYYREVQAPTTTILNEAIGQTFGVQLAQATAIDKKPSHYSGPKRGRPEFLPLYGHPFNVTIALSAEALRAELLKRATRTFEASLRYQKPTDRQMQKDLELAQSVNIWA